MEGVIELVELLLSPFSLKGKKGKGNFLAQSDCLDLRGEKAATSGPAFLIPAVGRKYFLRF